MTNRKRPVNRVTSARRPAAQRGSSTRVTAADLRTGAEAGIPAGDLAAEGTAAAGTAPVDLSKAKAKTKDPAPQPASGKPRASGNFWRTWRTAIVCGAAAVILAAFAVVAAFEPGIDDDNHAYVDNKATDEVKAATGHALSTLYAYKAADIDKDKWKAAVATVLTSQMRQDFEKYLDTVYDSIKQTQTDTEVKSEPLGVTMLTDDHAELLVDMNVDTVKDGKPEPFVSGPLRVQLEKQNGNWLVSSLQ